MSLSRRKYNNNNNTLLHLSLSILSLRNSKINTILHNIRISTLLNRCQDNSHSHPSRISTLLNHYQISTLYLLRWRNRTRALVHPKSTPHLVVVAVVHPTSTYRVHFHQRDLDFARSSQHHLRAGGCASDEAVDL